MKLGKRRQRERKRREGRGKGRGTGKKGERKVPRVGKRDNAIFFSD